MEKKKEELNIGVLDIYGFEIFQVKSIRSLVNDLPAYFRKMVLNNFASTLSMRNCNKFSYN